MKTRGFEEALAIQRAKPVLDTRGAPPVVALSTCGNHVSIVVSSSRAGNDVFDDVVVAVELTDAIEATVIFASQDPDTVALDLEEVLDLDVRDRGGLAGSHHARDLRRKV